MPLTRPLARFPITPFLMAPLVVAQPFTTDAAIAQAPSLDTIPPARISALIRAGSGTYNDGTCIFCHAPGGRGSGRRAPDLSDVEWLHSEGDVNGIMQTIFWGVRKEDIRAVKPRPFQMNPKGGMNITNPDLFALSVYVWSLSQPELDPFVAAQAEFIDLVAAGDMGAARRVLDDARTKWPDVLLLPENGMNILGYRYLNSDTDLAIEIFELNVELHPDAFNPWDSLAEGYMVNGDNEKAIEYYEKSLDLNPDNQNAIDKLVELRGE
jgi:tetratricopeptide (TPR) repeat protein